MVILRTITNSYKLARFSINVSHVPTKDPFPHDFKGHAKCPLQTQFSILNLARKFFLTSNNTIIVANPPSPSLARKRVKQRIDRRVNGNYHALCTGHKPSVKKINQW